MAAIDGPAGPSKATKSTMDGPAGPVVAGDHLRRDRPTASNINARLAGVLRSDPKTLQPGRTLQP